jgi:hypothetical protein
MQLIYFLIFWITLRTKAMKVYTINLTVECEPVRLAEAIQKRFADVVLSFSTSGPWEVLSVEEKNQAIREVESE